MRVQPLRAFAVSAGVLLCVGVVLGAYALTLATDSKGEQPPPPLHGVGSSSRGADAEQRVEGREGPGQEVAPAGIDDQAETLPATRECTHETSAAPQAPPVPSLSATAAGSSVHVRYEFLALPSDCAPKTILITVNSVDDLSNIRSASPDGSPVAVTGRRMTVTVPVPTNGPPPFEARASAYSDRGARSPVTTVPVTE